MPPCADVLADLPPRPVMLGYLSGVSFIVLAGNRGASSVTGSAGVSFFVAVGILYAGDRGHRRTRARP